VNALLEALRVYSPPYEKIRVGKDNDGGYIVCAVPEYDCFLSGGIGDDTSFEEHLLKLHPSLTCHAYDGTVDELPRPHPRITFHKQNISALESEAEANLHSLLDRYEHVLVKMDIEGSEYGWLESLSDAQLAAIRQMVIEFHEPFADDRVEILARLGEAYCLVHLHPNNYLGTQEIDGVPVPALFEATYLRRSEFGGQQPLPSTEPIPSALDQKNVPENPDIALSGYPYTVPRSSPRRRRGAGG
jgi:hypothetical protein